MEKYPDYWKLVAMLQRIDAAEQRARVMRAQLLKEHGLDPEKTYRFNDQAETISEAEAPPNG